METTLLAKKPMTMPPVRATKIAQKMIRMAIRTTETMTMKTKMMMRTTRTKLLSSQLPN
jgi:hypothetical protein